jgi:hypothetical protein
MGCGFAQFAPGTNDFQIRAGLCQLSDAHKNGCVRGYCIQVCDGGEKAPALNLAKLSRSKVFHEKFFVSGTN